MPASAVPLGELSGWPEELCRQELPTVLPRLHIFFAVTWDGVGQVWHCLGGLVSPPPLGRVVFLRPQPSVLSVSKMEPEGPEGERGPWGAVRPRARARLAGGRRGLARVTCPGTVEVAPSDPLCLGASLCSSPALGAVLHRCLNALHPPPLPALLLHCC